MGRRSNRPTLGDRGWAALSVVVALAVPARDGLSAFELDAVGGGREPITITADRLDFDYETNVIVYRGDVRATQGRVKLRSDTLTLTFVTTENGEGAQALSSLPEPGRDGSTRVQEVVAEGNVRIDQGGRWAAGGKAVFDQVRRTLVLTDEPVLHDGPNEVAGDRVVVYLDQDRSVVEGGRKRVKAVLYPEQDGAPVPVGPRTSAPAAPEVADQ